MADQSNSASAANSNSPARPCEKPTVSLQSFPFLFHIPIILIIPILPILIPEETKKLLLQLVKQRLQECTSLSLQVCTPEEKENHLT